MLHETLFLTIYCCFIAVILGACMGSFLNCYAWRIVHGQSIAKGRSHCDVCNHVLETADLIPVFSYLLHKGRCRWCGAKLSARHVWAELISAAVFVSLLLRYDISLQFLEYLLLACVLLAVSFTDLEGYIIPDRFLLFGIVVRLVFIVTSGDVLQLGLQALIGGFSVSIVLLLVVLLMEKLLQKEAMGGGDIKLIFVTGFFFGWKLNVLCLLLSCIVGIIFGLMQQHKAKTEEKKFPFGPSIAVSAWLVMLFGQQILDAYMGLF